MRRIACLLVLLAVACSNNRPTPPVSPEPLPTPPNTPLTATLSGLVFESTPSGTVPLPKAEIEIWVELAREGFPRPYILADDEGRYTIPALPIQSFVVLKATFPGRGLVQECGAAARMGRDTTLDIELVRPASPLRATRGSPTLSGKVYETTDQGIRPIQGVWVGYDWHCDDGMPEAFTFTDAAGNYALCRLPLPDSRYPHTCVTAFKERRLASLGLEFRGAAVLNIELPAERNPALQKR